jgi:hypothetical protein
VGGDSEVPYLAKVARDDAIVPPGRIEAALALGSIDSAKSTAAFRKLLKEARALPGAPDPAAATTPEGEVLQTIDLVFRVMPGIERQPITLHQAPAVSDDGTRAEAIHSGRLLQLKRVDGDWVIVNTEHRHTVVH